MFEKYISRSHKDIYKTCVMLGLHRLKTVFLLPAFPVTATLFPYLVPHSVSCDCLSLALCTM